MCDFVEQLSAFDFLLADSLFNLSSLTHLASPRKRLLTDSFLIHGTSYDSSISTIEMLSQETKRSKSRAKGAGDDLSKDKT